MKLSDREKILGLIVVVLVGFYLYDRLIIKTVSTEVKRLSAENEILEVNLEADQEIITIRQNVRQEVGSLDYTQDMEKMLPSSPDLAEVMSYLTDGARKQGVKICYLRVNLPNAPNVVPETVADPIQPDVIGLQLSVEGKYEDLISFIVDIENAPRIYSINHSNIEQLNNYNKPETSANPAQTPVSREVDHLEYHAAVLCIDINAFYN